MSERTWAEIVTESEECPECGAVRGEFCETSDLKPHDERALAAAVRNSTSAAGRK